MTLLHFICRACRMAWKEEKGAAVRAQTNCCPRCGVFHEPDEAIKESEL